MVRLLTHQRMMAENVDVRVALSTFHPLRTIHPLTSSLRNVE